MIDWKNRFERREPSGRPVFVLQGGRDGTVDGRYNVKVLKRRYDVTFAGHAGGTPPPGQ